MINYLSINAKFTPVEQDKEPEKWLEMRTTGIGGSDAGAILGMNKYASPLTISALKTLAISKAVSDLPMHVGPVMTIII